GVDPNGQVQPGLIQQVPGGSKLLNKLGIQPNTGSTTAPTGTDTATPNAAGTSTGGQTTAPATQGQPTPSGPGAGRSQWPFGKKKKKKSTDSTTQQPSTDQAPATTQPGTTTDQPVQPTQ